MSHGALLKWKGNVLHAKTGREISKSSQLQPVLSSQIFNILHSLYILNIAGSSQRNRYPLPCDLILIHCSKASLLGIKWAMHSSVKVLPSRHGSFVGRKRLERLVQRISFGCCDGRDRRAFDITKEVIK